MASGFGAGAAEFGYDLVFKWVRRLIQLTFIGYVVFAVPLSLIGLLTFAFLIWREVTKQQFFLYVFGLCSVLTLFGSIVLFGYVGLQPSETELISWVALMLVIMFLCLALLVKKLGWKYY